LEKERLQKILSKQGYGSRRVCEKLIADNRVLLNGKIAELGDRGILGKDSIEIDGNQIRKKSVTKVYIALNKPQRVLSEFKKQDDRKNINDLITIDKYIFVIGRLDYLSEGLLLLTNDGEMANKLTHPRYDQEKEYHVLIGNIPDHKQLRKWRRGIELKSGYRTQPAKVSIIKHNRITAWLRIIMKEGKKRQIREICKLLDLPVKKIIRTRIATIELGTLEGGEWRYLTDQEIISLKKAINFR